MAVTKTNKQAQSIAVKSIAAINKAETLLNNMAKFNAEFVKAGENVEALKSSLDLGFEQFEVEMNEKRAKLEADFEAKSETLNETYGNKELTLKANLEAISEGIATAKANATKEKEELAYELKKHIERENLTAATEIAYQYDKVLVSDTLIEDLNEKVALAESGLVEAVAEAEKKANASKHIAISAVEREAKSTQAILEGKMEAALDRAARAEESIKYLQSRLDMVPDQIAAAVSAAKADINQNNNSGK